MTKSVRCAAARGCLASLLLLVVCADAAAREGRRFDFSYEVTVGPVEAGAGPVHVFVPLARPSEQQRILSEEIDASIPGRIEIEDRYGNRFWHGSLPESSGEPITLRVETRVERLVHYRAQPSDAVRRINDAERRDLSRFLAANERVVVGDELLDPILREVRQRSGSDDPAALARASYDWVVDNVEYKKVGTGWGNGDTFWACSERYGNCTDFHALFISLSRTLGIPARFEIGFPISDSRGEGTVGGYHCWVEFYLPETGWFPIDASEAFKHPEKRQLYYGTQPADRIHFTTGRDLQLGADHRDGTLNYFVYPHVEVAGKRFDGRIEKRFGIRDVADLTLLFR